MSKITFCMDGSLGIVTLNDPPFNLLTQELIDDLHALLEKIPEKYLRGLLLKGDEGNFSAGANMSLFTGLDSNGGRELLVSFLGLIHKIEKLPYPTLAAVRGLCLGGGFELALACDLIWAANEAKFGAVEATIATVPLGAGGRMIAARAGLTRAKEMIYEAGFFSAEKLESWNIVNKILPESELNDKALKYMKMLSDGPTLAHATTKRLFSEYYNNDLNSADKLLLEIVPPLFETNDFITGVKSLLENGPGKARFYAK